MKVLLFVQNGDGRPKCVSRSVGFDPAERLQGQQWLADSGFYVWWTAHATAVAADRWWLVECKDAAAGRKTIAASKAAGQNMVLYRGGPMIGRILASGGRELSR